MSYFQLFPTSTFGGGCFWGTERYFKKEFKDSIVQGRVGYSGGGNQGPTYETVCSGTTGHAEVYHFNFSKEKVLYKDIVTWFFRFHDPTTLNQQGE